MRRADERRRREDEAGKLKDQVPQLESLRLEIDELHDDNAVNGARHIRHVVVEHAPALFEIPCGGPSCRDGGHDLTPQILRGLQESRGQFDGEHVCTGQVGDNHCGRVLQFVAHATYLSDPATED
jgi:hypothetical protein